MKTQHTPTPWEVTMQDEKQGQFSIGLNQDYSRLVEFICFGKNAKANAAHIVKCVNLHDELIAALKYVKEFLQQNDIQGSESVYAYVQQALKHAKGGE